MSRTREEAERLGIPLRDIQHQQHRRSAKQDYSQPGVYMITMATEGRRAVFGHLEGDIRADRNTYHFPHIVLSDLGRTILEVELPKMHERYPQVEVWRAAIMPDHLHLLIRINSPLPDGKQLGDLISAFKGGCSRAWWQMAGIAVAPSPDGEGTTARLAKSSTAGAPQASNPLTGNPQAGNPQAGNPQAGNPQAGNPQASAPLTGNPQASNPQAGAPQAGNPLTGAPQASNPQAGAPQAGNPQASNPQAGNPQAGAPVLNANVPATVPLPSGKGEKRPPLFEKGYHDRIISRPGMLETIKQYMADNPLRALMRRQLPQLMERRLHLRIGGHDYAAFGALFLVKRAEKEQVFYHRRDKQTGQNTEHTAAFKQNMQRQLNEARQGVVLVSPAISTPERMVINAAIAERLSVIMLQKEPIGPYWKPERSRFEACAKGALLILAPWHMDEELMERRGTPSPDGEGTAARTQGGSQGQQGTAARKQGGGQGQQGTAARTQGGSQGQQGTAARTLGGGLGQQGTAAVQPSDYSRFHFLNELAAEICATTEATIVGGKREH